ncbi:phenylalanine--tRNA ligase subunit alpha [archaeon]|nr:phenylalanine--tRNA ligase subunit alpha [archaeon]
MGLHVNEKKVLLALSAGALSGAKLAASTGLDAASVDRALSWLADKGFVKVSESSSQTIALGEEGKKYLREGLPERKALALLGARKISINDAEQKLGSQTARIALAWLTKLGVLDIRNGIIWLSGAAQRYINEELPQERVLQLVAEGKPIPREMQEALKQLLKRGRVLQSSEEKERHAELTPDGRIEVGKGITFEDEVSELTPELIVSRRWRETKLREYDVQAPTARFYPGRRHFLMQAVEYCRNVWVSLGFREMNGPLIESAFWDMDALFIPQDHPAREMQDTIYVEGTGELPEKKTLDHVRRAHERGVDGSIGWRYAWDETEARKLMLRTHTTNLSARMLYHIGKTAEWKKGLQKFFSVGRVFRNEVMDWKHGFEFNQTEGIVVGENVNFRNHIHLMREFYSRMGFKGVRFRPAYYPYTEMSLGVEVFHPVHKKWVELGGSGIFRTEVTEPLLGKPVPVLAWGLGFDRLVALYYNIPSFGDLYGSDLKRLRETKQWLQNNG